MNLKKKLAVVLAAATFTVAMTGAYAYFTDRVDANASATAGTLELKLVDASTPTPVENKISVSKTSDLKPGQAISLDYTLSNEGNKSADVKEIFVLTSSVAMTSGKEEFALYPADHVNIDANGNYTLETGATELTAREVSADGLRITYELPQYILNGKDTDASAEVDNSEVEPGITTNEKVGSYVLVIKPSMGNAFVNAKVTLEYEAQAKQHRNTNDNTWKVVQSGVINFGGDANHPVVPEVPVA